MGETRQVGVAQVMMVNAIQYCGRGCGTLSCSYGSRHRWQATRVSSGSIYSRGLHALSDLNQMWGPVPYTRVCPLGSLGTLSPIGRVHERSMTESVELSSGGKLAEGCSCKQHRLYEREARLQRSGR